MYQPNFCAECGQRIERARWHWWTSRKFCSACARRLRRQRWTLPVAGCAALAVAGFTAGRAGRPAAPPLTLERAALVPAPRNETANGANRSPVNHAAPRDEANDMVAERPIEPNEVVSMCGARTKKGTPCQRRVRGTGRCFQHLGKPAMLPASKLIVQGGTT